MKVALSGAFKNLDGSPILNDKQQPLTLREIACGVLTQPRADDSQTPGEEKERRWKLAETLFANGDTANIPVEQVGLLKDLIGKTYASLIVGQAWRMLEGGDSGPEEAT
jgi:hypothetical protein